MTLSATEYRLITRNRRHAIIAKVSIPSYGDIYLATTRDPFLAFSDPVNPILVGISGYAVSDQGRVSDIRLDILNQKVNRQASNPLASAVRFSDLIAVGLGDATVEIKELVHGAVELTASSFGDANLTTLFVGQVRRPFRYQDDRITVGATAQENYSDVEYPTEVIGETAGVDPRQQRNRVPILIGNCSADEIAPGIGPGSTPSAVSPSAAAAPAALYDEAKMVIVLSSLSIAEVQHVTVQAGQLKPAPVDTTHFWPSYSDPDHPGYTFKQIGFGPYYGFLVFRPVVRLNANPHTTVDYDHEDIGNERDRVELASGETLAVMAPEITDAGGAYFGDDHRDSAGRNPTYEMSVYIHVALPVPAGLQVRLDVAWAERKDGGTAHTRYEGVLTGGDLRGESLFKGPLDAFIDHCESQVGGANEILPAWGFFQSSSGFRVKLTRQDSGTDPLIVKGVFTCFTAHYGSIAAGELEDTVGTFGVAGKGIPTTGSEPERYHPSNVIKATLTDVLGVSSGDIDFGGLGDYEGTESWQFGFSLHAAKTGDTLLKELAEQFGARLVRDPDGKYRLRLKARWGAKPAVQRYNHALRFGVEVTAVPKVEPLGREAVKNVIVVDYGEIADGTYLRSAWVNDEDSEDGYGYSSPAAELISHASIVTNGYGPRRDEIQAYAIRDRETALNLRDYRLSRGATPPTRITVPVGAIGAYLRVGWFVKLDHETLDPVLLYNGESWADKWFDIEDIRRAGDGYLVRAISVPVDEIQHVAMVPRRVMVVP